MEVTLASLRMVSCSLSVLNIKKRDLASFAAANVSIIDLNTMEEKVITTQVETFYHYLIVLFQKTKTVN